MLEINAIELCDGAVKAVRYISLKVNKGELVTLLGANGAGKSSTLKSIAGVLKPTRGTIILNGKNITHLSPEQLVRRAVAMVPETRDAFPDLTVGENLQLGAFSRRRDTKGVAASYEHMLTLFPLSGRAYQATRRYFIRRATAEIAENSDLKSICLGG